MFDAEGALRAGTRDDLVQVVPLQATADRIRKEGGSKVISWPELKRNFEAASDLADYDTVIIDTAGEAVETLKTFATDDNAKNKGSFDGLSGAGWGVVSSEYSWLMNQAFAGGCDVVVLGQMREDRGRGDATVERLDMAGRARQIVMSKATQIGWYGAIGNRRQLRFAPEEGRYTKDSVGLGNVYVPEVPKDVAIEDSEIAQFLARTLDVIKGRINKRNEGASASTTPAETETATAMPEASAPTASTPSAEPEASPTSAGAAQVAAASPSDAPAASDDDPFADAPAEQPKVALTDEVLEGLTRQVNELKANNATREERNEFVGVLAAMGARWDSGQQRVVPIEAAS